MNVPIQYSGPSISSDVPWSVRQHLQLLYQKLANHTQAMSILSDKSMGTNTTTTSVEELVLSGSSGNSSSTAQPGIPVSNQSGVTSYTMQSGDNGALVVFSDASPVAVSLPIQTTPYGFYVANLGAGTVTLTPASGTISYPGSSSAASISIPSGYLAIAAFDGTNWWAVAVGSSGSAGVTSLNSLTGSLSLIAGSNVTITPSGSNITIAASGSSGSGYIKGTVTIGPAGGSGTYTGSGSVSGATVGSAVLVGVSNSTEASYLSNLIGWVSSANTVTIQATFSSSSLSLALPVVVFV